MKLTNGMYQILDGDLTKEQKEHSLFELNFTEEEIKKTFKRYEKEEPSENSTGLNIAAGQTFDLRSFLLSLYKISGI